MPMTEPYSLFSKIMMTMCAKFGTSGIGVRVGSGVKVGMDVCVGIAEGVRVGGKGMGVGTVNAGWQAEARKEAMIVIQNIFIIFFMPVL